MFRELLVSTLFLYVINIHKNDIKIHLQNVAFKRKKYAKDNKRNLSILHKKVLFNKDKESKYCII